MNNVVNVKVKRLKCLAPKLIYRFEQNATNGCWYNADGTFNNLYGKKVENIPMPRDNRPKEYRAGCFSYEDLCKWVSEESAKKLGGRSIVVLSTDYKILPFGEVIYNEENVLYKKVLMQY